MWFKSNWINHPQNHQRWVLKPKVHYIIHQPQIHPKTSKNHKDISHSQIYPFNSSAAGGWPTASPAFGAGRGVQRWCPEGLQGVSCVGQKNGLVHGWLIMIGNFLVGCGWFWANKWRTSTGNQRKMNPRAPHGSLQRSGFDKNSCWELRGSHKNSRVDQSIQTRF